jgi:hypothetical protein
MPQITFIESEIDILVNSLDMSKKMCLSYFNQSSNIEDKKIWQELSDSFSKLEDKIKNQVYGQDKDREQEKLNIER